MNANKNHIQTAGSSAHIMYYKIAVTKTLSTEKLLWKLPIIDILLYTTLQFTNTADFSFDKQVAGGFISFFAENSLSAALYVAVIITGILFDKAGNALIAAINSDNDKDTVARLFAEKKRISACFVPFIVIFLLFTAIKFGGFKDFSPLNILNGFNFLFISAAGAVTALRRDKLFNLLYREPDVKAAYQTREKRQYRLSKLHLITSVILGVGLLCGVFFSISGNTITKYKIEKQAKKYLSENYRDIYDPTVPISVSYNSDIDENGQKVIFYRAWATDNKGDNDLCLFYDKKGVLVNDCVKNYYLTGGSRYYRYNFNYAHYVDDTLTEVLGNNFKYGKITDGCFKGMKIHANSTLKNAPDIYECNGIYTGPKYDTDNITDEEFKEIALENGIIDVEIERDVTDRCEDFCESVVNFAKALKESDLKYNKVKIRIDTTKSVTGINSYLMMTAMAGTFTYEEMQSDELYHLAKRKYTLREEWANSDKTGEYPEELKSGE